MNKYCIKIPQDMIILYCEKKRTLTFKGPLINKSIKLKLKIIINNSKKIICVSPLTFFQISKPEKKKIKALQNTTVAQIKHLIIESSTTIFKKLKIIGVGYRADITSTLDEKLLILKLGFSHPVYVQIPNNLSLKCLTKTKFYIFGNSYNEVSLFSSRIRAKKLPDAYKGKGILYEDEIRILKEGKKV
jgi:large subunit ribosomal protein L6